MDPASVQRADELGIAVFFDLCPVWIGECVRDHGFRNPTQMHPLFGVPGIGDFVNPCSHQAFIIPVEIGVRGI